MIFHSLLQKSFTSTKRGFTLIELMVTISIVVLVTAVVLVEYSSFNSTTLLTSQAYITAFDLREAQSLAIGVRGQGTEFSQEYGIYFTMSNTNSYQLFQDTGTVVPATYTSSDVAVGALRYLDPRFKISDICVTVSGSSAKDCNINNLAVTFMRPDFDAAFNAGGGGGRVSGTITSVDIIFAPLKGTGTRTVTVSSAGQISVN